MLKSYHSGSVKKSIIIKVPKEKAWRNISNIIGLPKWVIDVKTTKFRTKIKRGIGAVRELTFEDGNKIEEHIVNWNNGNSITYIAVTGLPLRAYVATITLDKHTKNATKITWQSYLNSKKMSRKQFIEFLAFMGTFYEGSLENLKELLEK